MAVTFFFQEDTMKTRIAMLAVSVSMLCLTLTDVAWTNYGTASESNSPVRITDVGAEPVTRLAQIRARVVAPRVAAPRARVVAPRVAAPRARVVAPRVVAPRARVVVPR